VPALVVGVFRGAATGRQMWGAVAVERLVNTGARVGAFLVLWIAGALTLEVAVLISVVTPILAGLVYVGLLSRPSMDGRASSDRPRIRSIVAYGSSAWLGSVASMLLSRSGQLLMVPLSSAVDLGLYTVAVTISDVPLVVALAIQGALFGVGSKTADAEQHTAAARLTLLAGILGCTLLAATLPLWIQPLFGAEFAGATLPTVMLIFSALLCIPGLMAGAGLSAWGKPGLRSAGLAITLVVNLAVFVLLVPRFGVYGACWTSIASNVVLTSYMVKTASKVMQVPAGSFLVLRSADLGRAWQESSRLVRRLTPRQSRPG
jgi:O-antigen/teichoic acid export membrane protein